MTTPTSAMIEQVTGSEAGLSGEQQIRIALDVINKNNGTATTKQINDAVENIIITTNENKRLSSQGKASLRFFINKVAVKAGYIYKYDKRNPGWRITPEGRDFINSISIDSSFQIKMLTPLGHDFQLALSDVYTLLSADTEIGQGNTRASEAFIRSGIILTVTAWETFVEDTLKLHFKNRIDKAQKPEDMNNTFNAAIISWIESFGNKQIKPTDLIKLTGDRWKEILANNFDSSISKFNTPKSDNISEIFKKYLGFDIKSTWTWHGVTADQVCKELDEFITLRGALVHRGRTSSEPMPNIDRKRLIKMITLVEQLVWSTEIALNNTLLQQISQ